MNNLTLRQFRYFEALAQQKHFGRAAEVCAVSQPALSMQIKDLEESLGIALFERGPREVRLTGFGEDFAARVRSILQSVDELSEMALAAGEGLSGRFRLGVIPTIAPYLLPRVISDLTRAHEGLDLRVRETMTPKLLEELNAGQLDAAILALPVDDANLAEVALFEEAMLLVRPKAHEGWPMPDPQALAEMRLLLLEEGHCFRDQALSFCAVSGARGGLDGSSLATLVQMVGAGLGVTLIPEMAVEVEAKSAPVCVGRFHKPEPSRTVGMVWRKTSPLAEQLTTVAEIVRNAAVSRS